MKITQKQAETTGKEDNVDFIPVLSKSAQKRARKKEKCNSKSVESCGTGDTMNITGTSQSKKEERRLKGNDTRVKKVQSRRREVGTKKPFLMYKIVTWNIRGINNPYKKSEVLCWIKKNKLDVVAMLEVKLHENKWAEAVTKCSPDESWKADFSTIDGGWAQAENRRFCLIVVYASNNQRDRKQMWNEIEKAGDKFNGCWICMGDFNCVKDQKDKLNGNRVRETDTTDFRTFLASSGLQDLPASGYHYTWSNNHVNSADRI
ncbi:hypothetical protein QQ045_011835 [Rhodiola kirilowii]